MAERAVSDAISFVLIFALVVSSVGVVYVGGFSSLQDARDFERVNNAERAFEVLADNMEDLAQGDATSRATEIRLADADVSVGEPVVVNVSGERSGQPMDNFTYEFELRPIVYDANDGDRIVYIQGALIREGTEGAAMVYEPHMFLSENRTLVQVLQTRARERRQIGGSSTVLIRGSHAGSTLLTARSEGTYDVTVSVTTTSPERAAVWEDFIGSKPDVDDCTTTGSRVSCTVSGTERVYVSVDRIDVSFE